LPDKELLDQGFPVGGIDPTLFNIECSTHEQNGVLPASALQYELARHTPMQYEKK